MTKLTIPCIKQPGSSLSGRAEVFFDKEKLGEYPLLQYQPINLRGKYCKCLAPYSSLTVFRNIASGSARLLTYDFKLQSIFTLKAHFHSNDKKFTYRSDRWPGSCEEQYKRMLALAKKYGPLTYSMQLYDNRRAAPDDLLLKWTGTECTYQNDFLPFSVKKFTPAEIDSAIRYCNSIKNKVYENITAQVQL